MTIPSPGRPEVTNLNLYAEFSDHMDAAMKPIAEHIEQAEAMAKLRRVCAGDTWPPPPPPPPPPYTPVVDPFRRRSGGSVAGDGNADRDEARDWPLIWIFGYAFTVITMLIVAILLGWIP